MSDCLKRSGFLWSLHVDHIWIKLPNVFDRWEVAHLDPECPVFASHNLITQAYCFSIFYRSIIKTLSFKHSNHRIVIIFSHLTVKNSYLSHSLIKWGEHYYIVFISAKWGTELHHQIKQHFFEFTEAVDRAWNQTILPSLLGFPNVQKWRDIFQNLTPAPDSALKPHPFPLGHFSFLLLDVHHKHPVPTCAMWCFSGCVYVEPKVSQIINIAEARQIQTDDQTTHDQWPCTLAFNWMYSFKGLWKQPSLSRLSNFSTQDSQN